MFFGAVLDDRLAAGYLLQSLLAALIVEILDSVKTIAAIAAHHFAGLRYVAEYLGKFQQARFVLDDLLLCRYVFNFFS